MNNIMKHTALQFPPFKGGLGRVPLLLLLLLLFPLLTQAQENAYLEQIRVADYQLQPLDNNRLQLEMTLHFDHLRLDAQHALRLVPMLQSADGTQSVALDAIQLYGKQRYKVQLRANRLDDVPMAAPGDRLHLYSKGHTAPLDYTAQLAFQPWMVDSRLHIEAEVVGCARCDEGTESLSFNQTLLHAPVWAPLFADAQKLPFEDKTRNEHHQAYLQFAQAKHDIRPSLANNAAQLDSVFAVLKRVEGDNLITLNRIEVKGYVSPEGGAVYNQRLSERRAASFVDYVSRQVPGIDRKRFHAEGCGEAWQHFAELLAQAPLEQAPQAADLVQQAIANPDRQDAIDRQLRSLPIGNTLMQDYYPLMRRITYTLSYTVRPFSLDEARALIDSRPHLLSPYELQQVADSYLPDTLLYIAALEKAVKTYPEQTALAYNLALAQYKANLPQQALQTLQAAPATAPAYNLRGIVCMQLKQYSQAVEAFRQAIDLGSPEAKDNLAQAQAHIRFWGS